MGNSRNQLVTPACLVQQVHVKPVCTTSLLRSTLSILSGVESSRWRRLESITQARRRQWWSVVHVAVYTNSV